MTFLVLLSQPPVSIECSTSGFWEHGHTTLTVMDLVAVVLQAPNFPLLQYTVSHQQLEEAPVDICHDSYPSRAALHVGGS